MKVVKSECVQTMKPKDLASKFWDEAEEEALSVTPEQLSRRGHSPRRGTLLKIPGEGRFGDKQEFNFEDVKFQTLLDIWETGLGHLESLWESGLQTGPGDALSGGVRRWQ